MGPRRTDAAVNRRPVPAALNEMLRPMDASDRTQEGTHHWRNPSTSYREGRD